MATSGLPGHIDPFATGIWDASRNCGDKRLQAFLPNAGRHYAEERNYDLGPGDRSNVSTLSPWIRHRLVTEAEVVRAVLDIHSYRSAEKFIQEVLWRTYWKGWLELRPAVWDDYRMAVDRWHRELAGDDVLRNRFCKATEGQTGIDCFDAWAAELVEHGYLHNHARMWFASIWIFTLKLPWELGADFFLRFLLDGDPASNTLSWRWVAGIQTPGKTYLARPDNIAKFTVGRWKTTDQLATEAAPVAGLAPPQPIALPSPARLDPSLSTGLLVTDEDCHPESLDIPRNIIRSVTGLVCTRDRSPLAAGELPMAFANSAVTDAVDRAGAWFDCPSIALPEGDAASALMDWVRGHGLRQVVTAYAPVGPTQQRLRQLEIRLAAAGISMVFVQRPWDRVFWPHAVRGFFPFKDRIQGLLGELSLLGS